MPSPISDFEFVSVYCFNPMVGVLEGFRWSLVSGPGFAWSMLAVSGPILVPLLVIVLWLFRRVERTLPDYLYC